MSDFKQRLEAEYTDLDLKVAKLAKFIMSNEMTEIDLIQQSLLIVQLAAMKTYLECIEQRLEHLNR